MRVLVLTEESPDNIIGGRGTHIKELYPLMKERGIEVHIVSWDAKFYDHYNYSHSLPSAVIPFKPDAQNVVACAYVNNSVLLRHILRLHKENPFDVVHCHEYEMIIPALEFRELTSVPIVTTHHLFQHQIKIFEGGARNEFDEYCLTAEIQAMHNSDATIVVSADMKEYAEQNMFGPDRIKVIYNGVGREFYDAPKSRMSEKPTVLFCGRLAKMKGVEELFDAIEMSDDFYWIIMGKYHCVDEHREQDHRYTKRLNKLQADFPDRVKWLGHVNEKREQYFAAADFVIIPSHIEPFCIVALEALATGKPTVISSRVDGMKEFLNDSNSVLCEPSPTGILAALSGGYRPELVATGLETAKRFTWEEAADKTIEVYNEVLRCS